jgi:hypothetical protein
MSVIIDGTNGITSVTGQAATAVAGPAFSAYQSSAQSFTANITTKVQLQTKEFDTNNNFDNTTNYRFTPSTAGYYLVTAQISGNGISSWWDLFIFKNGVSAKEIFNSYPTGVNNGGGSSLIYLNGSGDYIEFFAKSGASGNSVALAYATYFQAILVRGA